ncbi:MAG: hypothetical protein RLY20_535 [Verrucomicrobiota bacterium]
MRVTRHFSLCVCFTVATVLACLRAPATENAPHAPFAQWADILPTGQWTAGAFYQESEAYHIWAGGKQYDVTWHKDGEEYGIDINQGWFTAQYGINERWTADLSIGYVTGAWRYFANDGNTNGTAKSTTGMMDITLGVRYQIWNETNADSAWKPTLTFRAGAILPGNFEKDLPFAPGDRAAAIEPELLARKHFGWAGFGAYADALFRWNRTTHNDHWIVSAGLFQQIKMWELNVGYRHLGSVDGESIQFDPVTRIIDYPRAPAESNDSVEAGFTYTTQKRGVQWGFYSRTVFDGKNSDGKFWVGGYINIPFAPKAKSK